MALVPPSMAWLCALAQLYSPDPPLRKQDQCRTRVRFLSLLTSLVTYEFSYLRVYLLTYEFSKCDNSKLILPDIKNLHSYFDTDVVTRIPSSDR